MSITRSVDREKQLTIFTVVGELLFEDVVDNLKAFRENPTQNTMWDLRKATLAFSYDEINDIVKQHVGLSAEARKGGKAAAIVSRDYEFGLSRMVEALSELERFPYQTMVFRSLDKAHQWLEEEK